MGAKPDLFILFQISMLKHVHVEDHFLFYFLVLQSGKKKPHLILSTCTAEMHLQIYSKNIYTYFFISILFFSIDLKSEPH